MWPYIPSETCWIWYLRCLMKGRSRKVKKVAHDRQKYQLLAAFLGPPQEVMGHQQTWSLQVWQHWSLDEDLHFTSPTVRTLPKAWTDRTLGGWLFLSALPRWASLHRTIFLIFWAWQPKTDAALATSASSNQEEVKSLLLFNRFWGYTSCSSSKSYPFPTSDGCWWPVPPC